MSYEVYTVLVKGIHFVDIGGEESMHGSIHLMI